MRRNRRNPSSDITDTLAFRRWFGKSVVVDEESKPQPVYHITTGDFDTFVPGGPDPLVSGRAIWLTPYPHKIPAGHSVGWEGNYRQGTRVLPLYAKIERPLYITDGDEAAFARQKFTDTSRGSAFPLYITEEELAKVKKAGYDGIIYAHWSSAEGFDFKTGRGVEIIVFEPTQVKSATANAGTFDPEDPSILRNPRRSHRRNPLGVQLEAGHPRLRPAQAFIDEWHARDMDRVFEEMGARVDVSVGSSNDPDVVNLDSLEATTYRKGAGSRALRALLDLTDKHNLGVRLTAEPFSFAYPAPADLISRDDLIRFYTRFGFRHDDAAESEEWDEPEEGYYPMFRAPPSWWTR